MNETEAFFDEFAEFYDAKHAPSVDGDLEFYVDQAKRADGPVLELGCGTGRIYLEMLREGVDATGIDLSAGMLDELRRKAAAEGLEPDVRRADMTDFATDRAYDLVVVPFRAFLHNTTRADQQATLRNARAALADGGRLAVNFFAPNFDHICGSYGETQATTVERDGEQFHVETETTFVDELDRVVRTTQVVYDDDRTRVGESAYRLRLVTKSEFELLLETTGFEDWNVYGGFGLVEEPSVDRELVWVAEA